MPGKGRQRGPVQRRLGLVRVLVAGDEGDARRQLAVRDRDARVGGSGDPRRDPRHDLERDAGGAQHERLLAAAPEHERIAALEPHDGPVARPVLHEQPVDLLLRHLRPAALLADVDELGPHAVEDPRRDQPVVEDHVGGVDQLARPHGQQPRVARAGADEEDRHGVSARSSSTAPARSSAAASSSPVAASSTSHSDPSGRPTKPWTRPPRGEHADRRVAGRLERAHDVALGVQRGVGRRVVGDQRRLGRRAAGAGLDRDHALPGGRDEDAAGQDGPGLVATVEPVAGRPRRAPARRPRPRRAWPAACRRCRAARRPRGPAARRAAGRGGAARSSPPARPRAPRPAHARRRARRTAPHGAASRRSPCPARARPGRPWPSAPRGRSRPPAARTPAPRPSATCRRAHGRRRPRS